MLSTAWSFFKPQKIPIFSPFFFFFFGCRLGAMALGISSYKAGCQVFHLQLKVLIFFKISYLISRASHTDEALFLYICIDLAKENKPVYFQQQKIIKYLIYIINYLTCNM